MQFDPLNDALAKIYNAEQAGKYEVAIQPASKLLGSVLGIMQKSGYIGAYDKIEDGRGGTYIVHLRYSVRRTDFERFEGRFLPAQDFGLLILTTNNGVMNHYDAKEHRIGGRLLAYVY
jgi:small subunit ribosomal protein S8